MQFHCLFMTSCMISLQYPRVPSYNHFKVIDTSCNGRRNVLLNNYTIDKFIGTINGFVCIRIAGGNSLL